MTPLLGIVEASRNQPNKALDKIWKAVAFKAMLNAPDTVEREGRGAERASERWWWRWLCRWGWG